MCVCILRILCILCFLRFLLFFSGQAMGTPCSLSISFADSKGGAGAAPRESFGLRRLKEAVAKAAKVPVLQLCVRSPHGANPESQRTRLVLNKEQSADEDPKYETQLVTPPATRPATPGKTNTDSFQLLARPSTALPKITSSTALTRTTHISTDPVKSQLSPAPRRSF